MKSFLIELPEALVKECKMYALVHDMTLKELVREVLSEFIKAKGGDARK